MIHLEESYRPVVDLFSNHPEISPEMRSVLIHWLSEVCEELNLHRETMQLALNYIDRYMSKTKHIPKKSFQLVGITALWIAVKVDELNENKRPNIDEFVNSTANLYCTDDMKIMEQSVLYTLDWKLKPITPNTWLQTFIDFDHHLNTMSTAGCNNALRNERLTIDDVAIQKQKYYQYNLFPKKAFLRIMQTVELSVLDHKALQFQPSLVVASAFSFFYLGYRPSSLSSKDILARTENITGYTQDQIHRCLSWLDANGFLEIEPTHPYCTPVEELPSDFHTRQYRLPSR
eukprot:TRINITY_DN3852_c0_g2_i4.p1 TRINITY_DN3852_c0_g2~~TRINITY_DN3852_c0_g2_i4.p1  ORF type:complete len:288 (-),score=36.72 TRINITY_DN3852_c0_g2_i4:98-961(-)